MMIETTNYGTIDEDGSSFLIEVISDKSDRVNKTALELFGQPYQYLLDKLEYKQKMMKGLECGLLIPCGILVGTSINLLVTGDLSSFFIWAGSIGGSLYVVVPIGFDMVYGRGAAYFINGACVVADFYNCFEDFKNDPSDLKVKKLFTQFENMYEQDCFNFISTTDSVLFQSTGKLFLLDAVVKIFQEKKINSILITQWNTVLTSTLDSQTDHLNTEPWKSLSITKPDYGSYIKFNEMRKHIKSVEFATKITTYFKSIMEQRIAAKII